MLSQVSWFIEERIIDVVVEPILRGYAVDALTRTIKSFMDSCNNRRRRLHIVVDVSEMQVSYENAELLYTALTPLMFEPQTRWIILYGASKEMKAIFKSIMYEMFTNPCIVLNEHENALEFLSRKDISLQKVLPQAV